MWSPELLLVVAASFLCAGLVKGVIGMGLPVVSMGLLTATIGLKEAIVLMLIPSLLSNAWQALDGKAFGTILRRLWTLLLTVCLGVAVGVSVLARADAILLSGVLGLLLILYAAFSLATPQIPPPGPRERWMTPAVGATTGVVAGLTGVSSLPAVLYMQALGLPRDVFVQAMGIHFGIATLALGAMLGRYGLLSLESGLVSLMAVLPAFLGMAAGRLLRRRLTERLFRLVFFTGLLMLGAYLAFRAFIL